VLSPRPESPRGSRYAWFVVGLWMACTLIGFVVVFNLGILLPAISDDLELSPGEQGVLGSAAFWGNIALTIPIGWWTMRLGPKVVIGWMLLMGSGMLFLEGWAPVFGALLVGRIFLGLALLALEPSGALLIQQWFPPERVVFVNSVASAAFSFMVGVGLVLTPVVLDLVGGEWRITFYVFGIVFTVLVGAWVLFARERKAEGPTRRDDAAKPGLLVGMLQQRDMWAAGLGFFGGSMTWTAFVSFFPTLALDAHRIPLQWSGGILAVGLAVGGVSGVAAAYILSARDVRKGLLVLFGLCMAGGSALMAISGQIPVLFVASFIAGIGGGYFPVLYSVPFQLRAIHPKQVSLGVAFLITLVSAGTMLGPLATGYLQELFGELRLPLLIVGLASLSLCLAGLMLRPIRLQTEDRKAAA
jgi:ACS family glucarate transporter-like MFS transporter